MAAPPKEDDYGFATKAVHCSQSPSQWNSRAIVPPITLSDTFEQDVPDVPQVMTEQWDAIERIVDSSFLAFT